ELRGPGPRPGRPHPGHAAATVACTWVAPLSVTARRRGPADPAETLRSAAKARKLGDSMLAPPGTQAVADAVAEGRGRVGQMLWPKMSSRRSLSRGRRLLFREDVLHQCEDLRDRVQIEHFGELLDL